LRVGSCLSHVNNAVTVFVRLTRLNHTLFNYACNKYIVAKISLQSQIYRLKLIRILLEVIK